MRKKLSFKTRKGKTVTYDGRRTRISKARKGNKLLADWKPMYIPDGLLQMPRRFDWSGLGDLFYDFMKVWFIFFLMLGWAGLVTRFVMWLFGG